MHTTWDVPPGRIISSTIASLSNRVSAVCLPGTGFTLRWQSKAGAGSGVIVLRGRLLFGTFNHQRSAPYVVRQSAYPRVWLYAATLKSCAHLQTVAVNLTIPQLAPMCARRC